MEIKDTRGRVVRPRRAAPVSPQECYDWVWDQAGLEPPQKLFLLALAENGGLTAEPARMCRALGISGLAPKLASRELMRLGLVYPLEGGGFCLELALADEHLSVSA